MFALVVLLSLPCTALTPEQEVEAWTPEADVAPVVVRRAPRGPRDAGDVAVDAAVPAAFGTLAGLLIGGTSAYVAAAFAASLVSPSSVAVPIAAGLLVVAIVAGAPASAIALVGPPELPWWAGPVVGASAVGGGIAGAIAGAAVVPPLLAAVTQPGEDCVACGGPGLVVFLGVPLVTTVAGAVVGAVGASTAVAVGTADAE